jgi:hypothetical protein
MIDSLTQADFQAIADLENVLTILSLEKTKKNSGLKTETILFIEEVLDKFGPSFTKPADDLKSFARNAKDFLGELLAYQPFSSFIEISAEDYPKVKPSRALNAQETEKWFEATRELANKIINHFTLLKEEQKIDEENSRKVDSKK